MAATVVIRIDPATLVATVEVNGIIGPGCVDLTRGVVEALGRPGDPGARVTLKPEYHAIADTASAPVHHAVRPAPRQSIDQG